MELLLASPARCKLHAVICFFECQGHYPHWHSSSDMQSLWATVYGHHNRAKVGQRVHVRTHRRPWRTVFWSDFGFGRINCKSGARNAWKSACDSSRAVQTDSWTCVTWQESSMTRVYKKCHSICKSALIAAVIMSENSWKSSLSINVTLIANKSVLYVIIVLIILLANQRYDTIHNWPMTAWLQW